MTAPVRRGAKQKEPSTWIAVPDDVAARSVTWHVTRTTFQLDGMSNVASPETVTTLCCGEVPHRIIRTSQLTPEHTNQDHLCGRCMNPDLCVPDGWKLEALPCWPDHVLISTPPPRQYMATIDFRARGFRTGYSVTGRFVGEEWNKRRTRPGGRGWRQMLVDDAVAHLREVLK